jgi:hypothetical protein
MPNPARVQYTNHARSRMRERGISVAEVEEAVRNPDVIYPDGPGRTNYVKGGIRVVVTDAAPRKVITVVRRP